MNYETYATWIKERLVNRTDLYRLFYIDKKIYLPLRNLTDELILQIAKSEITVALHACGPNGCKWSVIDIDDKRDEMIEQNRQLAFSTYEKLKPYNPLLECSNGAGGFHIWVLFAGAYPLKNVVNFSQVNQATPSEIMPVNTSYDRYKRSMDIGTAVRVPGRHAFRETIVSSFWNGTDWLPYGTPEFLDLLLKHQPTEITDWPKPNPTPIESAMAIGLRKPPRGCGSDWKIDGRASEEWVALHCYALGLDQATENVLAHLEFANYLSNLIRRIKCDECRKETVAYRESHALVEGTYFAWTVDFHNHVNLKLNKPVLSLEEALLLYSSEKNPPSQA